MLRVIGLYLLAALIAVFPALMLTVGLYYFIDLISGGGMLHTSGDIDQIVSTVIWFLITNRVFYRLKNRASTGS